jgi:hypothetical protein
VLRAAVSRVRSVVECSASAATTSSSKDARRGRCRTIGGAPMAGRVRLGS